MCDGSEAEEDFCWIATSVFPRQCDCVKNNCLPGGIANTLNCFICNRGAPVTLMAKRLDQQPSGG